MLGLTESVCDSAEQSWAWKAVRGLTESVCDSAEQSWVNLKAVLGLTESVSDSAEQSWAFAEKSRGRIAVLGLERVKRRDGGHRGTIHHARVAFSPLASPRTGYECKTLLIPLAATGGRRHSDIAGPEPD